MLLLVQAPSATKAESSDETVSGLLPFSRVRARPEPDERQRAFMTPSEAFKTHTHTELELSAAGRAGRVMILGSRLSPKENPLNHCEA